MTRTIGLMIGACAAAGLGVGAFAFDNLHRAPKSPYHIEKTAVDRGTIVGRVTATGSLSALVTVQVGSQVSGRIQDLNADFGSHVSKGQVIGRLDARLFAASLEQATANRQAAQANLAQAQAKRTHADRELERAKTLAAKRLIAPAELDARSADDAAAVAAVAAAVGDLAQARASQHQAEVNLGYTTIVSPIGGTVISRNVDVGQTVAASLQAPTLFTIAEDLRKMQVHTAVSEADVGKLANGMPATFAVDAYPRKKFRGVIRQIRDAPQTLQNVVTYDAVIDVDNNALELKPGMTANVTFVYAERHDVLRVPTAALRFRPPAELLTPGKKSTPKSAAKAAKAAAKAAKAHLESKAVASELPNKAPPSPRPPANADTDADADADANADADAATAAADLAHRSVWVLHGATPSEVPVTVGVVDGTRVEVESPALKEGDLVITDAINKTDRAEAKRARSQSGGSGKSALF
jgi:HlyD family secretion protein